MKQLRALYQRVGYTVSSFVLALSMVTAAVPFILSENVGAAPYGDVVVRSGASQGWIADNVSGATTTFINDTTSPYGQGALELKTAGSASSKARYKRVMGGLLSNPKLSSYVSNLSYYTKTSDGSSALPAFQLEVRLNGTASWSSGYTTLNFEPTYNTDQQSIQQGVWQQWSVSGGKFWSTSAVGSAIAKNTHSYTLDYILDNFPDAGLISVGVNIGSGAPNNTTFVDGLNFGGQLYDFEPAVNPIVTGENFNTHSGADYKGVNVGFNINDDFGTVSSVKVELFKDSELLATNTGNSNLLSLINISGERQLSTSFITTSGTYVEEYWNLGSHNLSPSVMPTRAVVTVVGANGTRNTVLTPLNEVNGWVYASLFTPAKPVHLTPSNNASINYNDFYFEWTDVEGAVEYEFQSSQNPTTVDGVLTNGVWNNKLNGSGDQSLLNTSSIHSVGATGTWYWQVRAIDSYGNVSGWTEPWALNIDMVKPDSPVLSVDGLLSGAFTKAGSITARWTPGSDDAVKYVYQYWNDIETSVHDQTNPYTTTVTGLARNGAFTEGDGTHYLRVKAVDAANNESEWSNVFVVSSDSTSPVAEIFASSLTNNLNPTIKGVAVEEGSGVKSHWFEIKAPNGNLYYVNFSSNSALEVEFNLSEAKGTIDGVANTPIEITDGEYRIRYVVTDKVGNRSDDPSHTNSEIHYLTIDSTAPVITLNGGDVTLAVGDAYVDAGATATDSRDGDLPVIDDADLVNTNVAGTYTVTYTVTDEARNTATATRTVTVVEPASQIIDDGSDATTDDDDDEDEPVEVATVLFPAGFANIVDTNPDLTPDTEDAEDADQDVAGATTDNAAQVAGASDDASWLGLAWYWWVLIAAAVLGAGWWLVGAIRRRGADAEA